jgi:hypothetical protein
VNESSIGTRPGRETPECPPSPSSWTRQGGKSAAEVAQAIGRSVEEVERLLAGSAAMGITTYEAATGCWRLTPEAEAAYGWAFAEAFRGDER